MLSQEMKKVCRVAVEKEPNTKHAEQCRVQCTEIKMKVVPEDFKAI